MPSPATLLRELPEPDHDPDQVRDRAAEILSRSEYQEPGDSAIERVLASIADLVESILEDLGLGAPDAGSGASSGGGGGLAWVVLVALVLGVLAFVVWAVATGRIGGRQRRRSRDDGEPVIAEGQDRTPGDWLQVAGEHEAAGRWREGVLYRYRSLVTELGRRGTVPEVVGLTAGELVRDVEAAAPAVAEAFTPATRLFEEVWYGGAGAGPGDRDRFAELAERTLAARPPAARVPVVAEPGRSGP